MLWWINHYLHWPTPTQAKMIDLIDTDLQAITTYHESQHTKIPRNYPKPDLFQQIPIKHVTLLEIVKATQSFAAINQIQTPVGVQTFWALILRALNPSSCYDDKVRNQTRLFYGNISPTTSSHLPRLPVKH